MRIHHATAAKARKFKITLTVEDNEVVATDAKGNRLASGMQGNKVLEEAITKLTGKPAKGKVPTGAEKARAKKARKVADEEEGDEEDAEGEDEALEIEAEAEAEAEDDSDAEQGKSIVKAKYRARYKPNKHRNGDELSHKINAHVSRETEDGEMRIDLKALRKFAEANGCWVPSYASLRSRTGGWNSGMARMNVANRLRAKIRRAEKDGEEYDIVWA